MPAIYVCDSCQAASNAPDGKKRNFYTAALFIQTSHVESGNYADTMHFPQTVVFCEDCKKRLKSDNCQHVLQLWQE